MAHSLSAKKRVRQNEKKRLHNRSQRNSIRSNVKRFLKSVEEKPEVAPKAGEVVVNLDPVKEYRASQKRLDRLAAKGVLHPNTAARRKSRLAKRLKAVVGAAAAPKA